MGRAVTANGSAFDNEKYLKEQSAAIAERIRTFDNKLYLEFGGKLLYDFHAARVLPGFDPNVKMRLLHEFRDRCEILVCVYAGDIENRKVRADFGITYDADVYKLIDELRENELFVRGVVITRFAGQPAAVAFKSRLEKRGVSVYTHAEIHGYPSDIDQVVSPEGYGANPFIQTTRPLVVITAPGPNSGKMATCLSQVYHEHQRGLRAGYAKFETFPVWNLPLQHPVNAAYEAATAELRDVNMIDPFHLEAYGKGAVNYNRDVESFPLLRRILGRITGSADVYKSPTDMGVNRAGFAITDNEAASRAALQEIIRRYFRYACEVAMGTLEEEPLDRIRLLMKNYDLIPEDRPVVLEARRAAETVENRPGKGNLGVYCGAAIQLSDGSTVTGCNTPLMHAASALVLNAIKKRADIPPHLDLIGANVLGSIRTLRTEILGRKSISMNLDETLIALGISSTTNPIARLAMEKLLDLHGCELHLTHIPTPGDESGLRQLGVNLTCDPRFATEKLFVS